MTPDTQTSPTLIRIRETQAALDRATAAMDTLQEGLSAVEMVAEKADSARRHPIRTGLIALLVATLVFAVMVGIKNLTE